VRLIEAAYNDARGVTAEFNRNALAVLNRELGATFDPGAFAHRAFYDHEAHRIEMHLASTCDQSVTIPGIGVIQFPRGETIRTEISCKYDRKTVDYLFAASGLAIEAWTTDRSALFALVLGRRRE
jgi:L-histidine N-alpha-methyltransferase